MHTAAAAAAWLGTGFWLTKHVVVCRLGEGARRATKGWGLELLCKNPRWRSDALTVIETPKVSQSVPSWLIPL